MNTRVDKTLAKGLRVLEALAESREPLGVSALAERLELTKSNVHRLIGTLRVAGYVTQESDRTYRCTMKVWELGNTVMGHVDLPRIGARTMQELARVSGESVHLAVLDGARALYVENIDSHQPVRAYSARGGTAPLHCVATGKILLAFNYDALRDAIAHTLVPYTSKTITTPALLDREVKKIRDSEVAFNVGEYREDVGGVAAPVRDSLGGVIASVGISGPLSRLTRQRMKVLAPAVHSAGDAISDRLNAGRQPAR